MVLYILQMNSPTGVELFPPSFNGSDWLNKITTYLKTNNISAYLNGPVVYNILKFNDLTSLNNWLSEYSLTDATLLADLNTWKSAHGVSFESYYFDTTNATEISGPIN